MQSEIKHTKAKLKINPELLAWAREQASLSLEEVVNRIGIKPQKATKQRPQIEPTEKLKSWEKGLDFPSLGDLKKLAKLYQRPLMTFFLSTPPRVTNPLIDFRTIGSVERHKDSPAFSRLKRRMINLQEELSSIVKLKNKGSLDFVGCTNIHDNIYDLVENVRKRIKLTFTEQCKAKDEDDLFRIIRDKIQSLGVYVVLEGDLGNYKTSIDPNEFRGMTITDNYAPLIVINPRDGKAAKLFSLLHEFAHILLGQSSVSNVSISDNNINPEEIFCNKFAAEFLLPTEQFKHSLPDSLKTSNNISDVMAILKGISKIFKVSIMVVARRAYDLRKISHNIYSEVIQLITQAFKRSKENRTSRVIVNKNKMDKYRLGNVLFTVVEASENGDISLRDASQMLNLNYNRFNKVLMA